MIRTRTAGVLLALAILPFAIASCRKESTADEEFAQAYANQAGRPLRLRLSGLPYKPFRRLRGSADAIAPNLRLSAAAHALLAARTGANDEHIPRFYAAAGLLAGDRKSANDVLEREIARDPRRADLWNDLAVCRYESSAADDTEGLVGALAAADHALSLSPASEEAAFNRAAILETLSLEAAAIEAWNHFLRSYPASAATGEAREALGAHSDRTTFDAWKRSIPALEAAVADGATATVDSLVHTFPQQARTWGEGEYLRQWGDAWLRGDRELAARALRIARVLGARVAELNGETLLRDAVAAIDAQTGGRLDVLAHAHVAYADARKRIRDRRPTEVDAMLDGVERAFAAGGSPMELVTRNYRAGVAFDQRDAERALSYLDSVERNLRPGFHALRAQMLWERARIVGRRDDPFTSLTMASEASAIFRQLGETENAARTDLVAADVLTLLGRTADAWRLRREIFKNASATASPALLQQALHNAAGAERLDGHLESARSLLDLVIASSGPSPLLAFDARLSKAFLERCLGALDPANLTGLHATSSAIADPALREEADDRLRYFEAVSIGATEAERAIALLNVSVDFRARTRRQARLAEALLERGRLERATGDDEAALHDLQDALDAIEEERDHIGDTALRDSFFDVAGETCDELVALHEASGNDEDAFSTVDRCRAREIGTHTSPASRADVQRKLKGDTSLVVYAPLPKRLLIWIIDSRGVETKTVAVNREDLARLASETIDALRRGDETAASAPIEALSRALIAPLEQGRVLQSRLVVIPDPILAAVPLALLKTRNGKPLVAATTISVVPSASAFVAHRNSATRTDRALIIGDPAFAEDGSLTRLPAAATEARVIARMYPDAPLLIDRDATVDAFVRNATDRDVIHIGAHALVSVRDARDSAFLLARSEHDAGVLTLRRIESLHLHEHPIVVLAGCKTGAFGGGRGSIRSLSWAFLAAGSRSVVGSLWDVGDETSGTFSAALHRRLRAGVAPADALRATQLEMLASPDRNISNPAAWAAFQVYGFG